MTTTKKLELLLDAESFHPVVLTTTDGTAWPIGKRSDVLMGVSWIVIKSSLGYVVNIPYDAIAHITEKGTQL